MRQKFRLNTGVQWDGGPVPKGQELAPNGVLVVPFYCENVPEGSKFIFASDHLDAGNGKGLIVREVLDSYLLSKYAFFSTTKNKIK
jgi:hypothetical protein